MATITLRSVKGTPLTNNEVDANFTNLNNDKIETSAIGVTVQAYDADLAAVAGISTTGLITRTSSGAASARTLAVSGGGLSVTNGNGVSGNPTIVSNATSSNTAGAIVIRDASGNFTAGTITANLVGDVTGTVSNATTATTATNIAGGTVGSIVYQTNINTTSTLSPGISGYVLTSNGVGSLPSWQEPTGGGGTTITVSDDTSTDATYYPSLSVITSGTESSVKVSSTKLQFNPSTGTLNATIFNSLSDENQKTNVKEISNATEVVGKINGVEFDWVDNGNHSAGVIAQQLEQVLPFLVNTDNSGLKSVNYSGLIAYLIQSNKELAARIEALENK